MPENPFLSCSCKPASYQRCTFAPLLNKHSPCFGGPFPAVRREQEAFVHLVLRAAWPPPRGKTAWAPTAALRSIPGQEPSGVRCTRSPPQRHHPFWKQAQTSQGLLPSLSPFCSLCCGSAADRASHALLWGQGSALRRPSAQWPLVSCMRTLDVHMAHVFCVQGTFHTHTPQLPPPPRMCGFSVRSLLSHST